MVDLASIGLQLSKEEKKSLKQNWHRPQWWLKNAIPLVLMRTYFRVMQLRGTDVVEEDWDNLIILDACRYDHFEDLDFEPGRLESRWSKGSSTGLFLTQNFGDRTCNDTVYVTGNPMYKAEMYGYDKIVGQSTFHDTVDVWTTDWDDKVNTVRPEAMVGPAKNAHDEYPNKRLIVHFLQPHAPFIGDTGERIREQRGVGLIADMIEEAERKEGDIVWNLVEEGELDLETAVQAYRENLELAIPFVKELVNHFDGKTVITADHGELLGENAWPLLSRQYGHPNKIWTKHLTKVPWHVVDSETRKDIIAEKRETSRDLYLDESETQEMHEKLSNLGYE
jgi:hypothetical protein